MRGGRRRRQQRGQRRPKRPRARAKVQLRGRWRKRRSSPSPPRGRRGSSASAAPYRAFVRSPSKPNLGFLQQLDDGAKVGFDGKAMEHANATALRHARSQTVERVLESFGRRVVCLCDELVDGKQRSPMWPTCSPGTPRARPSAGSPTAASRPDARPKTSRSHAPSAPSTSSSTSCSRNGSHCEFFLGSTHGMDLRI